MSSKLISLHEIVKHEIVHFHRVRSNIKFISIIYVTICIN